MKKGAMLCARTDAERVRNPCFELRTPSVETRLATPFLPNQPSAKQLKKIDAIPKSQQKNPIRIHRKGGETNDPRKADYVH